MRRINSTVIAGLGVALLATPLAAQQADSLEGKLREQLRASVQQLRDLQANQASLEAAKKSAEAERDALKAKLASAGKGSRPSAADQQELARLRSENERLRADARAAAGSRQQATEQQLAAMQAKLDAAVAESKAAQATAASASAVEQDLRWGVTTCASRNEQLVKLANDMVADYEKGGSRGFLQRSEPFLKLGKVAQQNQAQLWGDKVYALRFDPYRERAPRTALTTNAPASASPATNP